MLPNFRWHRKRRGIDRSVGQLSPVGQAISDYLIEYLIVGGGGGGGPYSGTQRYAGGGGGGGGRKVEGAGFQLIPGTLYNIIIGNGGAVATNGGDSSAFGITAIGGGGAGNLNSAGKNGGSGGGASGDGIYDGVKAGGLALAGIGYGFKGGSNTYSVSTVELS